MHLFGKLSALLFIGFQIVGLTYGSSIDCANTQDRIEKLICASPSATKVHNKLFEDIRDTIFAGTLNDEEVNKLLKSQLSDREKCDDVKCITEFYNDYAIKYNVFDPGYDAAFSMNYRGLTDETMLWDYADPVPKNDSIYKNYDYIVISLTPDDGTVSTYERAEYQLCGEILQYINSFHWHSKQPNHNQYATRVIINFPKFKSPPWVDLNPKDYLELISRIDEVKKNIYNEKHLTSDYISYDINNIKLQTWVTVAYIYKEEIIPEHQNVETKYLVRIAKTINENERSRIIKYSEGKPITNIMDRGEVFFVTSDYKYLDRDVELSKYEDIFDIMLNNGIGYFISQYSDPILSYNLNGFPYSVCSYYYHSHRNRGK